MITFLHCEIISMTAAGRRVKAVADHAAPIAVDA